jgi:glucose-6-phosphate-specific signal transduction histidine kinase
MVKRGSSTGSRRHRWTLEPGRARPDEHGAGESAEAALWVAHGAGPLDGARRMAENRHVDRLRALLLADDDERRAIERRLHDGVQQLLVAIAANLQVARGLVEADPQAAARLLDEARADLREALDELREVAERVHPPLLDTQGLVAALRMAAAAAPIPTRVEGSVDDAVPPELAVTVYRGCVATLAAAGGENPRATVVVRTVGRVLEFEIVLSGASVDPGALDPFAARVEALGGALEIAPTCVAGRLPLPS